MNKRKIYIVLSFLFFSFSSIAGHDFQKKSQNKDSTNQITSYKSLIEIYEYFFQNESTLNKFKYIKQQKSSISDFFYYDIAKHLDEKEKIKQMQNLAEHISTTYGITLINSEEIVINAFNESKENNLEPILVLSVIEVESTYKQYAQSQVGAVGLTQIMPVYHNNKIRKINKQNLDLWSIQGNIRVGTQILKEYIDLSNGNIPIALQRYNGSLYDKSKSYSQKVLLKMKKLNRVASL